MNTYLTWQFYITAYFTPISHVGFHLPLLFSINIALYFSYPKLRMSSVFCLLHDHNSLVSLFEEPPTRMTSLRLKARNKL